MKKQKSEDYSSYTLAYRAAPFFLVIFVMAFAITFSVSDSLYKENLNLHNQNAGLWCQSQTYEEILVEEQRNYTDEFYTKTLSSKQNDYGLDVEIGYFFKNNTRIQKEDVNDIIPEGLVCEVIGSGKCFFEIPAITKLQKFETGKYYPQNNEIECIRQSRKL